MNKFLIIPKEIVTSDSADNVYRKSAVEIVDQTITSIIALKDFDVRKYDGTVLEFPDFTLVPGFIQTHIHLCQTMFRGLADDLQLLDWLKKRIFPYENAHNKNSLKSSARLGLHELQISGTTTILDMGTVNHQEIIFDELINSGIRAIAGKCMMDINDLYSAFKESTEVSLATAYELAKEFHLKDDKIKYGFAPRFVLSCSEKLLRETSEMMRDFPGSMYHTHSSENQDEVAEVRRRTGKENIEYFESINILSDKTVLAHCVHLNNREISSLKSSNTRVAHCPSSNLKLGSGIANIPRYLREGISVSLGADGAPCNNNLSVFNEMRLAALIHKPIHGASVMDAKTVFRLATIEGAKALNLDKEIGSIEPGKKADIVLLNLNKADKCILDTDENIYSDIVYSSDKNSVREVWINGKHLVENGVSKKYDENSLIAEAKYELNQLLKRTEN